MNPPACGRAPAGALNQRLLLLGEGSGSAAQRPTGLQARTAQKEKHGAIKMKFLQNLSQTVVETIKIMEKQRNCKEIVNCLAARPKTCYNTP